MIQQSSLNPVSLRKIFIIWLPLAGSWALMALELPALSAIVARLAEPEINLAAYGGVVFPLSLIIEAPIIMLLAASTALSKDWASYRKLNTFMMITSAILTALHVAVAFTPLYYFVVEKLIGAPAEIIEPARIGLKIMTPWTWSIAYRRFNQGLMIRFGQSWAVTVGTFIRLSADITVLLIGYSMKTLPGIVVATSAVAAGVVSEAIFAGLAAIRVKRGKLRTAPALSPPLTYRVFFKFYIPLAMTSLLSLLIQPLGSAALSRMPQALESLAVWPVVIGLSFLFRSMGMGYNEVVVSMLDQPGAAKALRRFTVLLVGFLTVLQLGLVATPLAPIWFRRISALSPELATFAHTGMWLALLLPALTALQSWYQGTILNSKKTRAIPEAVLIFLVTIGVLLGLGIAWGEMPGLYVGLIAFTLGMGVQTLWLWVRSRPVMRGFSSE
ncbi:MAG: hypothetical protein H8E28_07885 [Anaerolineae bacterium]|nr:hypothetical protein [Anaerolineae bacterium]MBL6966294.1 hypothetical protein [Anaerolineales bacterium]